MKKKIWIPLTLVLVGIILLLFPFILFVGSPLLLLFLLIVMPFLNIKMSPLRIFTYGTMAAIVILGVGLLFMNPPQCPDDWYQTGTTNCATGANIGLGMVFLLAIGIWILGVVAALARYARLTFAQKDTSKWVSLLQVILVTLASGFIVFWVILLLQYMMGQVVDDGYRGPDSLNY